MPLVRTYKRHTHGTERKVCKPLWFRVVALDHHRGGVDDSAYRLAVHLSQWAHTSGRIPDMGDVMEAYQAFHGVSRRTAWNDVRRLGINGAGYLRQSEAPAPGRAATYQLCIPESLPQGLPADLAEELAHVLARPRTYTVTATSRTDPDPTKAVAQAETVTRMTSTRVEDAAELAELVMYAKGSILTGATETGVHPTWLHTSQFSRGCSTPTQRNGTANRAQRPTVGGKKALDDILTSVLARCAPRWQSQRGAAGGLNESSAERLKPLIRGALMYQTSAEVINVITEAVATARDLGAVVASRLRKLIITGRRILHLDTVKADDLGKRYAEVIAERAQQSAETMGRPRTRRALAEARAAIEAARTPPVGLSDRASQGPYLDHTAEAPEVFAQELAAAGIPHTAAAWHQAEEQAARAAAHRAALAYARTGQPTRAPQGPRLDDAAAAMWSEGDPEF